MKWLLQQYFLLPRWERLGNIGMVGLLLVCMLVMGFWPAKKMSAEEIKALDRAELALVEKKAVEREKAAAKKAAKGFQKNVPKDTSTVFIQDINTATYDQLRQCGLSKYVAGNILKYREKGGKIETIDDAKKLYGMTPEMLANLVAHTHLDSVKTPRTKKTKENNQVVDLNTADSLQLIGINGIGGKTASRIITFRNSIGKFHDLAQLSEVWGIRPENLDLIKKQLKIEGFAPFVNINTISENDLFKHAYFRKDKLAKILVSYREKHGRFKNPEDLKKCKLVTDEVFAKIIPYIVFD